MTTIGPAAAPRRRSKIVCTLGPVTAAPDRVAALVAAGMDVARLNFSHGDHADHEKVHRAVREAAERAGRVVGVLADLQGPKIRLGRFTDGPLHWAAGTTVRITVEDVPGTPERVSTTYAALAADAKPGDRLLVDDGRVGLEVVAVEGPDVVCTVTVGGTVSDNKGLSLPGMDISVPALSAKDVADLEFALGLGVDLVALSFVRSPTDIDLVHAVMDRVGHRVPVIAKLEKPEAVDDIEAVVDAFDGLMVARGDLGVEMPLERVPLVQKRAIQRCREKAKPVIVATQMLDSMIVNPRPTRAEASDVANAVLDGADAVMLSGETSVGAYPVETVQTMARIIEEAESDRSGLVPALREADHTQPGLLAQAALAIGDGLDATALVTFTLSGNTVRRLARLHPRQPLVALTPVREVRDQLALSWGTRAVLVPDVASAEDMVRVVDEAVLAMDGFARGDVVVIVAGAPPHTVGVTDLLRVRRLGDDIA